MHKLLSYVVLVLCIATLTSCNGSSGDNVNPNNETPVATTLSLALLNPQGSSEQSFNSDTTITAEVTLTDQFGQALQGSRVNFSSDLGDLSLTSTLTNANGIATIEITNSENSLGAGTLSATVSSLTESANFEYLDNSVPEIPASLAVELRLNGQVTNQFKSNEQVQIVVTLLDKDNMAMANEIVKFTAEFGQLNTETALTDQNGITSVTLTGDESLGAGVITASLADDATISNRLNYQVIAADSVVLNDIRIGYFDQNNDFVDGAIKLSIDGNTISAGGTVGLSVDLIDSDNQRINTPTAITFTSNCVLNNHATIDETVFSIKGRASATFEDIDCAGTTGTDDVIVASITANGVTNTASTEFSIQGEQLGSIEFVSAEPTSIVIKGSGGQETSTLTFKLKSALGNALAQQQVDFSLDSSVGDISLSRTSGFTNSEGFISTQVSSGSVPAVVRVTAQANMEFQGETVTVQTQSSELSVNTGLPEQASMTIAATVLNPEASTIGETSQITVWLADSFNNPVPDGTTVNFTTEGGNIGSSCNTVSGNCAVEWTATEPYLTDHRSTILATASGHETFFDNNGNNIFDDNDGDAISNSSVNSGFGRQTPLASGFVDMSEAWRDDNENNVKDAAETKFFDDNGDGVHSSADGKFNGPHCIGDKCDDNAKKSTIRKALVLIMSEAQNPNFVLSDTGQTITYQDNNGTSNNLPTLADGSSTTLRFRFADNAMQTMPLGTTVNVALDGGELQGTTSVEVSNTNASGYQGFDFTINNAVGGDPETATLTITIQTPNTLPTTYVNKQISLL